MSLSQPKNPVAVASTVRIEADAVVKTIDPGVLLGTPANISPQPRNLTTAIRKPRKERKERTLSESALPLVR